MFLSLTRLLLSKPQLLADHAGAYAQLVAAEIGRVSALWRLRFMLQALALVSLTIAVVLAGVALMLWAVVPPENVRLPWALIGTPLVPLLAGLCCLLVARYRGEDKAFDKLRHQWRADLQMLREASTP
jgi:uncharacterized membrane protein YqjE